jgi:hypothetical protein
MHKDILRTFRMATTRVAVPQKYCPEIEEFCREYWQWVPGNCHDGHWETRADWKDHDTGEWITCRHIETEHMWEHLHRAACLFGFSALEDSLK